MFKKLLTVLLFVVATVTTNAQFSENFDGLTTIPSGWVAFEGTNGLGTTVSWEVVNDRASLAWEDVTGGNAEDWLVTSQFTVDASFPLLTFNEGDSATTDYGSVCSIRISTTSQTSHADFTSLESYSELNNGWTQGGSPNFRTIDLSSYIGQDVYIAFVMSNDDGDLWAIDDIAMISSITSAPDATVNPTPADGATDVELTDDSTTLLLEFTWEAASTGDLATEYDFKVGSQPGVYDFETTLSDTSITLQGMSYDDTVYWTVVAKNSIGDATGSSEWMFTTQSDPSLSVDEFAQDVFVIFPNPTQDVLNITSSDYELTGAMVYNTLGQQVAKYTQNQLASNQIDTSSLAKGMYVLKLISDNKYQTIPFVKN